MTPEQARFCCSACISVTLSFAACGAEHAVPDDTDAGRMTNIDIVIERVGPTIEIVPVETEDDADAGVTTSTSSDGCAALTLSIVGPHQIDQGAAVVYEAHVMGRPASALEYGWSASNGDLSNTDGIRTVYTCKNSGSAAITLRASEIGMSERCGTAIAQAVWCAEPDE